MRAMEQILSEILEEITPKKDERIRIENLAKELEEKVKTASELVGVERKCVWKVLLLKILGLEASQTLTFSCKCLLQYLANHWETYA